MIDTTVTGTKGADTLTSDPLLDEAIYGRLGADTLISDGLVDVFYGGKGRDLFITDTEDRHQFDYPQFYGGAGKDTLRIEGLTEGGGKAGNRGIEIDVSFNPNGSGASGEMLLRGQDNPKFGYIKGIEVIHATDFNDVIDLGSGQSIAETIYGGAGDDRLLAGGGDNRVFGGDGDDTLGGNGTLKGGKGRDTFVYNGFEGDYYGGRGKDSFNVTNDDINLYGGKGNDRFNNIQAGAQMTGGSDADTFVFVHTSNYDGATVKDFDVTEDRLHLRNAAFETLDFDAVVAAAAQSGDDTIITITAGAGEREIILTGVTRDTLTEDNFIF